MCKLRQIIKNYLPGILMFVSASLFAQEDSLSRAQQLYRTDPEAARLIIDRVIVHPQTQNDYVSWTLRAYVYYELYRKTDRLRLYSPLRDTILSSIKTSFTLKPDSANELNNKKMLKTIWAGYYNLCKALLQDSVNYQRSLVAYNKFKEVYLMYDPTGTFEAKDVEYYLAVGSVYSEMYIKDPENTTAGDIAKVALLKVLDIQPDNAAANINLGLLYYNQAVYLSKKLEFGADFTTIDIVQENMIKLAKQAEFFIIKVYNKDPENLKANEALFYIYRMLNEFEKSDQFKKRCMERGIKFDEDQKKEAAPEKKDNQQK